MYLYLPEAVAFLDILPPQAAAAPCSCRRLLPSLILLPRQGGRCSVFLPEAAAFLTITATTGQQLLGDFAGGCCLSYHYCLHRGASAQCSCRSCCLPYNYCHHRAAAARCFCRRLLPSLTLLPPQGGNDSVFLPEAAAFLNITATTGRQLLGVPAGGGASRQHQRRAPGTRQARAAR